MAGKRDKPEEIVLKLWQVEVLHGQGMAIYGAVRQIGLTEPTYYHWRKPPSVRGCAERSLPRLPGEISFSRCPRTSGEQRPHPLRRRKCIDSVRHTLGGEPCAPLMVWMAPPAASRCAKVGL
ncbi:hypothetical protein JSE7799_02543 [Jannaschia seosinensis]|uniref:Transposase n=1 Tax=Jannaschia seosinensis TaxID=313367 RepID=A0A0M7BEM2_9RHOB|nr:hypothetical protein JSE7799_02543 [Jannaschia seosinensis]